MTCLHVSILGGVRLEKGHFRRAVKNTLEMGLGWGRSDSHCSISLEDYLSGCI